MANPFTPSGAVVWPNGPAQAIDALTSLASGAAKGLGKPQAGVMAYDINVAPIKIKSNATGVSATGTVTAYIVASEDGVNWTDGIDPTSSADQSAKIITAPVAAVINVNANATTYFLPPFSIAEILGYMPLYASVVIKNGSGAALDATAANFAAMYDLIQYT